MAEIAKVHLMETRVRDLLRDGAHEMNENLEAINASVSLGNTGGAVANLEPKYKGIDSALGWMVRVGGPILPRSGGNRAGA